MMSPFSVVVVRESDEFTFKISDVPKEGMVQVFATDRSNQSLDEWMRLRRIGEGLDLIDFKDPKIGFPSVVSK